MRRTLYNDKGGPIILANDPSLTAWGYVLVQDDKVLKTGCVKTQPENKARKIRKGDDRVRRTGELVDFLLELYNSYTISLILVEQPHGSRNASSAVMIGIVLGVLKTFATCMDIPIEWYTEGDCKKALLGKVSATKQETIDAIQEEYTVPLTFTQYIDEAVHDAMAVYHVAKKESELFKLLRTHAR